MTLQENIQEILATSYDHEGQIEQLTALTKNLASQFLNWANEENGNLPVNAEELFAKFEFYKRL